MDAAANAVPETEAMQPEKPTALAPRPAQLPVKVTTPRALVLAQALEEEREQRELLKRYVTDFMVQGEDYGTIPGVKKRSLFKPGAEKLMDLFRCRPEYEVMAKEVNHQTGLFYYEIRCRAVNRETDTVLNEGVGSASSYESKYRYRNASRVCPNCGKDSIIKGKAEYGGGWVCFAKKGGCGAKWSDGAAEIEGQEVGKIQNPDLADVANVVLKMAKKRAQVDCAIALARVSDLFTQDVEDLIDASEHADDAAPKPAPKPAAKPAPAKPAPAAAPLPDGQRAAMALWTRVQEVFGDEHQAKWKHGCDLRFKGPPPKTAQWSLEDVKAVETLIFGGDDIPF